MTVLGTAAWVFSFYVLFKTIRPTNAGTQEIVPPEHICLSSLTSSVSPFARLAQASNLLGRVIRHCNDTALELEFVLDNFEMLCQTIFSLVELLSQDDSMTTINAGIAATICFRYTELPSYIAYY